MNVSNSIELTVKRWSAWAPNLEHVSSWHQWANGERAVSGSVNPDVSFVSSLLRRRLSEVSRMAFKVATDCLDEDEGSPGYIFCSRYGEFNRSFEILNDLAERNPVSPAAFSMSVHNTAASLFSIHRDDRSQFITLAAGETTLETAFVEAWCQLSEHSSSSVLLVYHDQLLPDLYHDQRTTINESMALGLLLYYPKAKDSGSVLRLNWSPNRTKAETSVKAGNSALDVIRMLLNVGEPISLETSRLIWTWSTRSAAL